MSSKAPGPPTTTQLEVWARVSSMDPDERFGITVGANPEIKITVAKSEARRMLVAYKSRELITMLLRFR